ncbi:MAG: hypothetical protein Q8L14_42040 [Myxococcales bacterium]|nr:hypothetical protein [Myxococcales bacterium]
MRRRLTRLTVFALAVTVLKVGHCAVSRSSADESQRLAYLGARLDARDVPGLAPGAPFDGEWLLVEHSFAVAAATNLAFRHPEQHEARRIDVKRWVESLLRADTRAFDTTKWNEDALTSLESAHGHVGFLGHLSWALGASCLLGNELPEVAVPLAAALARRFDASPSALLETYPGETYVPDNVVAIAGLSLLQRCRRDTRHAATIDRFLNVMRAERLDPDTGVLVFAPGQMGRGSGAAWMAYFLTFIDEPFAREQFTALFREFGAPLPFGAFAIREWPRGVERGGDVDSGPLVFGLSPSGTGFALAGPAFTNDDARLLAMLSTAELVGTSVGSARRRYLFSPLVGDAITLATRTATPWRRAPLTRAEPDRPRLDLP